jgi:hypothetical protein
MRWTARSTPRNGARDERDTASKYEAVTAAIVAQLELAGISVEACLWPQPVAEAGRKDVDEHRLHDSVCGWMTLRSARRDASSLGPASLRSRRSQHEFKGWVLNSSEALVMSIRSTDDGREPIILGAESVPFLLVLEEVEAANAARAREAALGAGLPNRIDEAPERFPTSTTSSADEYDTLSGRRSRVENPNSPLGAELRRSPRHYPAHLNRTHGWARGAP